MRDRTSTAESSQLRNEAHIRSHGLLVTDSDSEEKVNTFLTKVHIYLDNLPCRELANLRKFIAYIVGRD